MFFVFGGYVNHAAQNIRSHVFLETKKLIGFDKFISLRLGMGLLVVMKIVQLGLHDSWLPLAHSNVLGPGIMYYVILEDSDSSGGAMV